MLLQGFDILVLQHLQLFLGRREGLVGLLLRGNGAVCRAYLREIQAFLVAIALEQHMVLVNGAQARAGINRFANQQALRWTAHDLDDRRGALRIRIDEAAQQAQLQVGFGGRGVG